MKNKILTFEDFINDEKYVSKEEKMEIDFQVELIGKLIEAREKNGLSQRELAKVSNVKQPMIARIESLKSSPQINTICKLLLPLGYKLTISQI